MRLIPSTCLKEGMKVGKSLHGVKGELLLQKGAILKKGYIERLQAMGYNGLYIEDKETEDIEVVEAISQDLRMKTVQTIKNTFMAVEAGKPINMQKQQEIGKMVTNIVEEILENKNCMFNMVDLKTFDDYTFYHSVNVTVLSVTLGMGMGSNQQDLYKLGLGALLHDIGKVFIPIEILNKPGKLTNEEYEKIKEHAFLGYKYLKENFDVPITSYVAALQHHERYDGTGYPNNLKADKISLFGRIMAVADVYDAITSDRPYRKGFLPSESVEHIMAGRGTMFDPKVVDVFLEKVAPYPIGTKVKLSDGRIGYVAENYTGFGLRPKIKIIQEKEQKVEEYYYIDLKMDRNLLSVTIVEVIKD